jgi:hypothetical protein
MVWFIIRSRQIAIGTENERQAQWLRGQLTRISDRQPRVNQISPFALQHRRMRQGQ